MDETSPIYVLFKSLLTMVTLFIDFAGELMIPATDASGAYIITPVNVVVWVSVLFPIAGSALAFLFSMINRKKRA